MASISDFDDTDDWGSSDPSGVNKFNPRSAASIRSWVELILGVLQTTGLITEKQEGYDFKKDMPKTDKGEDLF